jgi:immune inhibitor A
MRKAITLFVLVAMVFGASSVYAMPLDPEVVQKLRAQGKLQQEKAFMEAAIAKGINQPDYKGKVVPGFDPITGKGKKFTEREAIVLLVDFSDNVADTVTYPPSHYMDMLFSEGTYPTGSMRDYYLENSYGQFGVSGSAEGYYRMPQTYDYYVNGQRGFGSYPRNAQKLTEDAVLTADPYIDFSQYDNDGPDGIPDSGDDDGYVDALFVVHAGTGYESSGDPNDIHSHKWATSYDVPVDGVYVRTYSMEPDDGNIGVFCHEFGHVLGLPDLYDYDYDAAGTGWWSIMSRGSWGNGGVTPVHFDAWCKSKLGFVTPTVVTSNMTGVSIPRVEDNAVVYALWTNGLYSNEYFLVENRETTMFDSYLPGSGLMIYHVDEFGNNDDQMCGPGTPHCLVAVEQADGNCDLEYYNNSGDDGDPYPGSTSNTTFDLNSTPDSRDYGNTDTQVAVTNIAASKSDIVADFQVERSVAG